MIRDFYVWDYLFGDWEPRPRSYTWQGQWYDPNKYDLVVRDSYKKELIAQKEKELTKVKEMLDKLTSEIERLRSG